MILTITDLNPSGLYSFGWDSKQVQLDKIGLTSLHGINKDKSNSSNGAGKTSLFNSITTILFDKNPAGESGEAVVNEKLGACCAKLGFTVGTTKWRIIYTRKWKKAYKTTDNSYLEPSDILLNGDAYTGTDVYLEKWDGTKWRDERAMATNGNVKLDIRATRAKIVDVIGMDYDQFISISYLAQQQSLRFINGTHKDRMQIIAEICNLGAWDSRKEAVKSKLKDVETKVATSEAKIAGMNHALSILMASGTDTDYGPARTDLLAKIAQFDQQMNSLNASMLRRQSEEAELTVKQQEVNAELRALSTDSKELNDLELALDREYTTNRNQIINRPIGQEYEQLKSDLASKKGYIIARRHDIEQLMTASGKCPKCRSNVTLEHLTRHKDLLLLEINELECAVTDMTAKLQDLYSKWELDIKHDINVLDINNEVSKATITNDRAELTSSVSDAENRANTIKAEMSKLASAMSALRSELSTASSNKLNACMTLSSIESKIEQQKAKADEKQQLSNTIAGLNVSIGDLSKQAKYLSILEKMFGDKGIKAHKLNSITTQLNSAIATNLDIISDKSTSVWITPFKESKTSGEMIPDIQIMIKDKSKQSVPFSLYSGGERQQVVLAIIGAFWHVASQQGSGVNLLCLDEVFGPMDASNAHGAIRFLEHMKTMGKNSILVVTHNKEISDQIMFDNEWVIVKHDGLSVLTK